jgi:hypothetical protein
VRYFCFLIVRIAILLFALYLGHDALRGPHNNTLLFGVMMACGCTASICFLPELIRFGGVENERCITKYEADAMAEQAGDARRRWEEQDKWWQPGGTSYEAMKLAHEEMDRLS